MPPPPPTVQDPATPPMRPQPLVVRALQVLKREPALLVTVVYLFVSFVGVWCSYWYFRRFGIPILDYLQATDFLVAGLRDPAYLGWVFGLGVLMYAISWPTFFWRRDPARVAAYRETFWGRCVFPFFADPSRPPRRLALSTESAMVFGILWGGIWVLVAYVNQKAETILDGSGRRVAVTLQGESKPLQGEACLLGTSSAYAFVYWPSNGRAEAIANETIGRIEVLPRRLRSGKRSISKDNLKNTGQ